MKKKTDWPRLAIHLGAWITLLVFVVSYFTGNLTANPIQTIERYTGKAALIFLILSLACTPLSAILGIPALGKFKKNLGLYGFMFAAIHLLIFIGLDYGFNFLIIWLDVNNKLYIWIGVAAFVLLLALAVTSFKKMKQLLKKNWKRLHRAVYIIAPLVVGHFLLIEKGNVLSLQGNLKEPFIYGGIVLLLLALRLPPVKNALVRVRTKLQQSNRRADPAL